MKTILKANKTTINQLELITRTHLRQLEHAISQLSDHHFYTPIPLLGDATIGEHTRHILEFYIELFDSIENGIVNYDLRKRDHELQTLISVAIFKIKHITSLINREDCILHIALNGSKDNNDHLTTSYSRELLYNIDHCIHHMAFIKIGISSISNIKLPSDFGIAAATTNFRKSCAQ